MPSQSILLVEDSEDIFRLVQQTLGRDFQLEWAKNLREARAAIEDRRYSLILLDVMLPDGDGYQLCSLLQTQSSTQDIPVIFLTAKNSTSDKVLGFSVGADDYVSKPFDPLELKARIETKLRKIQRDRARADIIQVGGIEINKESQKVTIQLATGAEELDLTPIEYKLLVFLAREPNKVFSRDEILNSVWGEDIHVFSRSVDTHISKLRKKLGSYGSAVHSVHGTGYKLVEERPKQEPRLFASAPNPAINQPHSRAF